MPQPTIVGAPPRERVFAASAVALQAILINNDEQFLLLSARHRYPNGAWQFVTGAMEQGESVLAGVQREVAEEVGSAVATRPLGTVHAHTFHYDANVQYMVSIYYLMAYEGGEIVPGDDMVGSDYRWWSLDELLRGDVNFHPCANYPWLFQRSVELFRLWRGGQPLPLQEAL